VTIDERGLRPTPGEDAAQGEAIRILCFGGSTMMGMGARDDHTIPAVLARRLGELSHRVAVTNYGQLGHNSTQEAITLQQLLKAGERIDIAVFYDGINEMACAEQTGRADGLFNEARRRAEFNLLHSDRRRELFAAAMIAAAPRTLRRLRQLTGLSLAGPLPATEADLSRVDIGALAAEVIAAYAANLRLVRLLAREYGFRPIFFWQPALTTKRTLTRDEQRWDKDYTKRPEARRRLYAAILDAWRGCREIADAADTVDLSALFDDWTDPVYIDLYHLSEAGNAAVAEAMLPSLAAAARVLEQNLHAGACGPLSSKVEKYRNGRPSHRNSENGWPKGWHTEQAHCCFADGDSDGSRADQCHTRLGGFSRRRTHPADDRLQRSEAANRATDGSRESRAAL
jgi:lysophospholipase L1-like esterase